MTNTELLEYNKDRVISQICLVTKRDIETVLDEWIDKLKIGPWTVITITEKEVNNITWHGKPLNEPFKIHCAVAMCGNIEIEIVQPVYGPNRAAEFVAAKGDGLFHFKEKVSRHKMKEIYNELTAKGIIPSLCIDFFEDSAYNFITEDSIGFDIEIGNGAEITLPEGIYYTYPRE